MSKAGNFLEGLCSSWEKPSPRGDASSLAEVVVGAYGLTGVPGDLVPADDPLFKRAGEVAAYIIKRKPGRVFLNADYDVDGTSSAAILGGTLRHLGWDVRVFIPDRFEDSYGVNHTEITNAWEREKFDLLVAADCGATEMQWLGEFGKRHSCGVVVIDHHKKTPHEELGVCEINPQNHLGEGCHEYGYCTAVLAVMVCEAIFARLGKEMPTKYKTLAGMAAMADVTAMDCPVARHYAKCFLGSEGRECVPLDALVEVSRSGRPLETSDALFKIIPMLNAAGRMRNATVLVALWDCDDYQECLRVATRLWSLNRDRRRMQEEVVRQAGSGYREGDRVLLAWHESWHPGVVGPAAGQLVERFGVPVFLGGLIPKKGHYSFSGRAPEGVDIHALLSASTEGLPVVFGGHKAALGMKVKREDESHLQELEQRLSGRAAQPSKPKKKLAGILKSSSVNYVNYQSIRSLEPFGSGFPSPIFCVANLEVNLSPMGSIADSAAGVAKGQSGHSFPVAVFKNPKLARMRKLKGHAVGEMVCSSGDGEQVVKLLMKDFIPTT
jgi:single-stranded-DNA-specific exonuclease